MKVSAGFYNDSQMFLCYAVLRSAKEKIAHCSEQKGLLKPQRYDRSLSGLLK